MNSTELLEAFRSELRDQVEDYLWSDSDVYRYMNDAQKMFCRLTGGISDSTSALTSIPVASGDTTATYDERILNIRRAFRGSDSGKIDVYNDSELDGYEIDLSAAAGLTTGIVIGMDQGLIRILPEVLDADTIELSVSRLPLNEITHGGQALEIQAVHHMHLISWMGRLAHMKMDAETFDKKKSAEFERVFRDYCAEVKGEKATREHKGRAVRYRDL